jgi:hypothetical protein
VVQVAPLPSRRQRLEGALEARVFPEPFLQLLRNRKIRGLLRLHAQARFFDRDGLAHVRPDDRGARPDLFRAGELHHAAGVHLAKLHQHLLRIFQQRPLKESEPEILLEALQDDDVRAIQRVGRLAPLALFRHPQAGEHTLHCRDLCLPPVSIRHFHAGTPSNLSSSNAGIHRVVLPNVRREVAAAAKAA